MYEGWGVYERNIYVYFFKLIYTISGFIKTSLY